MLSPRRQLTLWLATGCAVVAVVFFASHYSVPANAKSASETSIKITDTLSMPIASFSATAIKGPSYNVVTLLEAGVRSLTLMSHSKPADFAAFKEQFQIARSKGLVKREDVFVNLWVMHMHDAEDVMQQCGLDYVELLGQHNPAPDGGKPPLDFDASLKQYRHFEDLYNQGKAKALGIGHIEGPEAIELAQKLHDAATVKPVANQVALSPVHYSETEHAQLSKLGIYYMGFSALGGLYYHYDLSHPTLTSIASTYGKTTRQVVLRWFVDKKMGFVTGTSSAAHAKENLDIFDFALSADEINAISALEA